MADSRLVLSVRDAHKSYGDVAALRGISLDLYEGELLGFLGPNGAGKTTLIRALAGRCRLDRGELLLQSGLDWVGALGLVPQTLAIFGDLTAQQNLMAFGRLHGVRGRDLRSAVEWALEWCHLFDRRHRLVKTFSGGMQRRLNIACSVLHQPRILLLDEPTVGVDPQSRERIYRMLSDLLREGTAILLTTHQLDEAEVRCQRIAIIDHGQLVQVGSLHELIAGTVGPQQRLTVRFRQPPSVPVSPVKMRRAPGQPGLDRSVTHAGSESATTARLPRTADAMGTALLNDVTDELPDLLRRLHAANAVIDQIVLQAPSLQDVFLHLTGRELRE